LFIVTALPPITRTNTSLDSHPRPLVRVSHISSPPLPHPSHVLHPVSKQSQASSWTVRLNYSIPLVSSSTSSLVVSCVFLALLFLRSPCVERSRRLSLYISISPLPLLSHVCANTLPYLIPLSFYSRRSFFLCTSFSLFSYSPRSLSLSGLPFSFSHSVISPNSSLDLFEVSFLSIFNSSPSTIS